MNFGMWSPRDWKSVINYSSMGVGFFLFFFFLFFFYLVFSLQKTATMNFIFTKVFINGIVYV